MQGTLKIQGLIGDPVMFAGFSDKGKPLFHNPKAIFPDKLTPAILTRKESKKVVKKLGLSSSLWVAYWVWDEKK